MFHGRLRKVAIAALFVYTLFILFFLYVGFGRTNIRVYSFRYNLTPDGINLYLPMGGDLYSWLFNIGNYAAFIPFGIMLPLLYRIRFFRFALLFVLSITILETIQMVTRLGSFDINDIILNTLGALTGYFAQRLVSRDRDRLKGFVKITVMASVMASAFVLAVGGSNHYLTQTNGETVSIHTLTSANGHDVWEGAPSPFAWEQQTLEPQINRFDRRDISLNEFIYPLDGQYVELMGNTLRLDQSAGQPSGEPIIITFSEADKIIYQLSLESGNQMMESFNVPLLGVKELTIKVENDQAGSSSHLALWDVVLTEANSVQKIAGRFN